MKTEFKAKFLQHVAKKRKEEGFTLIELLVVIIIIGILSAIALPSFLNQANKAKQSEAKQYLASINKGQQAYYAENGGFITDRAQIGKLGLGIKTATGNYTYDIGANTSAEGGANAWTAQAVFGVKFYAGLVYLTDASGALTSQSALCESTDASAQGANTSGDPLALTECGGDYPEDV
ncbi:MAG: prepilin-type N-terminal cleavage/methylation domain-containing protein [Okeania sp. SIO3I5]|uniref:type IV pilin-like G/H family protein n=1 Tax=Okeania sp. SIO3I5 TaxID=2607805 RepID=UPI0013B6F020|nr:type IV pilin-like G/H family protein [Okeania sp. SIO3I5]NEQ34799.1 prepilin-type N-terminal cleavage/methylation domain-containing protein [Okeania sp. SIO3I5]